MYQINTQGVSKKTSFCQNWPWQILLLTVRNPYETFANTSKTPSPSLTKSKCVSTCDEFVPNCFFSSSLVLYSSRTKMPPKPQFGQPQRSFLEMEFHRRRGTKNFLPGLPADFAAQFPDARVPSERVIRDLHKKFLALGRINNKNSKSSPGVTHSGRPKTSTCNQRRYLFANVGYM